MSFVSAMENIVEKATQNNKNEKEGYIGANGLRYCGLCNTPTQCVIKHPFTGQDRIVPTLCKCKSEKYEREQLEVKKCQIEGEYYSVRSLDFDDFRLFRWFNNNEYKISPRLVHERDLLLKRLCFPEAEKMQGCTFENSDGANPQITTLAKNYVENFAEMKDKCMGLLLFGETGVGKSHIAACIANALLDKDITVRMTNFERISNELWDTREKQGYMDMLNRFDLLVLDDLAAEKSSEYMDSIIFNIIDSRLRAGLPIIVTTNLSRQELQSTSDMRKKRIYSRLFECCIPQEVVGSDRRRAMVAENREQYGDMLKLGSLRT